MATPATEAAAQQQPVSAQVVGNAFVQQYYHILHQSPGLVHQFYQDVSKLGRPDDDGIMSTTTTMDAINVKILSLNYDGYKAEIKSVDAQESLDGGVNVLVTGYLIGKDNILRNFTQSFFLAPQDKGYFVLNDIFRYMESATIQQGGNQVVGEDAVATVNPEQAAETVPVQENHVLEQEYVLAEEANGEEVINPSEDGEASVVEEELPVPEVIDEVQVVSPVVIEPKVKPEDEQKKTFASVVMKSLKQNAVPLSSPVSVPWRSQPKIIERQANIAPQAALAVDAAASGSDVVDAANNEEDEADGYSIYIKGLPMNSTPELLEEEFKKFGPIKNNGIQVRNNRGFIFGFVEFEVPEAVQKAIEASPVTINGRKVVVEEKKSTFRGRGRFPIGRGGFRNDVGRGRGNYGGGGRGYGRNGDFGGGNRTEFGGRVNNRGGSSNRGGKDGYQMVDNNGGRMNRGMGGVNETAKNMAPRVPATA